MQVFRSVPYEGYRLTATDTEWSVGGLEIRGPMLAILLLLTGRLVCLLSCPARVGSRSRNSSMSRGDQRLFGLRNEAGERAGNPTLDPGFRPKCGSQPHLE